MDTRKGRLLAEAHAAAHCARSMSRRAVEYRREGDPMMAHAKWREAFWWLEASRRYRDLRRAAKSRIEAMTLEAKTKIERMSLEAQTQVSAAGLDSDAAKSFLEGMTPIETLMPPVDAVEIKQLVDQKRAARSSRDWYN